MAKAKKKAVVKWRPASMGATKGKILGVPPKHLMWGAGGAGASLVTSYVTGAVFRPMETPTLNPTMLGAVISAVGGYAVLSTTKALQKNAVPWVVGSLIPLVAKTAYDLLFVAPAPAPQPA